MRIEGTIFVYRISDGLIIQCSKGALLRVTEPNPESKINIICEDIAWQEINTASYDWDIVIESCFFDVTEKTFKYSLLSGEITEYIGGTPQPPVPVTSIKAQVTNYQSLEAAARIQVDNWYNNPKCVLTAADPTTKCLKNHIIPTLNELIRLFLINEANAMATTDWRNV
jgi:hypothetical protein